MTQPLEFLAGGGSVGALMRAHDWSTSPLGPPESWPQSLRAVVGLMLQSRFPMFVAWGKDLGFLYNDPIDHDGPGWDRVISGERLATAMNTSDQRYARAAFSVSR